MDNSRGSGGSPIGRSTVKVEPTQLRARWDVNLGRLRRKLGEARVRTDLVSHDGRGNVLLVLEREDVARDEA